jgi:hypothetical protein
VNGPSGWVRSFLTRLDAEDFHGFYSLILLQKRFKIDGPSVPRISMYHNVSKKSPALKKQQLRRFHTFDPVALQSNPQNGSIGEP